MTAMKILKQIFVMWSLSGMFWVVSFFLAVGLALMGEYGGILAAVVRLYAVMSCILAILTIPAMFAYPPDDLASFVLTLMLICFIYGLASYAIGWDRRLHGDWSFQTWYLWGKRLLLTCLIGTATVLLVAIIVIASSPHP